MQSLVQPEDPAGGWQGLDVAQTASVQPGLAGHGANCCLVSRLRPFNGSCAALPVWDIRSGTLCSHPLQSLDVPACGALHVCRLESMHCGAPLLSSPSGCPADAAGDDSDGSEGFLETLQREVTQERVPAGGNAEEHKTEKEDLTCR